ncbi:hypothetical protein T492DRAFT_841240 [Pavlovales sp. CCMP2436]|nr:hypothetical protein T492DRAFT_841240 [Pavlovales sp. CCMP2436]
MSAKAWHAGRSLAPAHGVRGSAARAAWVVSNCAANWAFGRYANSFLTNRKRTGAKRTGAKRTGAPAEPHTSTSTALRVPDEEKQTTCKCGAEAQAQCVERGQTAVRLLSQRIAAATPAPKKDESEGRKY